MANPFSVYSGMLAAAACAVPPESQGIYWNSIFVFRARAGRAAFGGIQIATCEQKRGIHMIIIEDLGKIGQKHNFSNKLQLCKIAYNNVHVTCPK